jgi:CRISPR-associated protein Csb2
MQIVLRQVFPLGRFHATPWRANPFDDPYGEWPPSPWRLVRAAVARWYQWAREETSVADIGSLDDLAHVLCNSRYCFHLPLHAGRGRPARQYFPVEFGWNPKAKKKAGMRTYATSLAQDNYWCIPTGDNGAVWWFVDSAEWTNTLITALDRCLDRMIYFGRAETFTRIQRTLGRAPDPNCQLSDQRVSGSVPVLVPRPDAQLADVERITDDPDSIKRSVPQGSRVMYAVRPSRPPVVESRPPVFRPNDCPVFQFAIGWSVAPERRSVVRMTSRF